MDPALRCDAYYYDGLGQRKKGKHPKESLNLKVLLFRYVKWLDQKVR